MLGSTKEFIDRLISGERKPKRTKDMEKRATKNKLTLLRNTLSKSIRDRHSKITLELPT